MERREEMAAGDEAPPGEPAAGEHVCPKCKGNGQIDGSRCEHCGGTGRIQQAVGGG